MWPTRRSRRAGERGAAGAAGVGLGLGCFAGLSFFFVVVVDDAAIGSAGVDVSACDEGALEVLSTGAAAVVLTSTFFSISWFRAALESADFMSMGVLSIDVDCDGFLRPTTRGLSCPPVDDFALLGDCGSFGAGSDILADCFFFDFFFGADCGGVGGVGGGSSARFNLAANVTRLMASSRRVA